VVRGISTASTVRRAAAIAVAGAAATALSACGAGLETQTDQKQSAIAGVNIDTDHLALRDLQVEFDSAEGYASGDDAALRVWIGNEGDEEISLIGVESEAGTVTLVSADAEATPTEAATTPAEDETTAGDDATADETADTDETADSEETSTPAGDAASESPTAEADPFDGETSFEIPIAPADYVRLDQGVEGGDYLLLEGLGEELVSGQTVTVTFFFSDGTEVEAALPVGQALAEDEPSRSYFEPEEEAEGH
jgi:copper(I)-binding protein